MSSMFLDGPAYKDEHGGIIAFTLPSPHHGPLNRFIRAVPAVEEDTFWCAWTDTVSISKHFARMYDMRTWQAIYNVLSEFKQAGLPTSWPEVFYYDKERTCVEFWEKFSLEDGFLIPTEFRNWIDGLTEDT